MIKAAEKTLVAKVKSLFKMVSMDWGEGEYCTEAITGDLNLSHTLTRYKS